MVVMYVGNTNSNLGLKTDRKEKINISNPF